jgi:hypothetical protein
MNTNTSLQLILLVVLATALHAEDATTPSTQSDTQAGTQTAAPAVAAADPAAAPAATAISVQPAATTDGPPAFAADTDPTVGVPTDSAAIGKELDRVRWRLETLKQQLTASSPGISVLFSAYDGPEKAFQTARLAAMNANPDTAWLMKRYPALARHRDELKAAAARPVDPTAFPATSAPATSAPAVPADAASATTPASATGAATGPGDPEIVATDDLAAIDAEMNSVNERMDAASHQYEQSTPDLAAAREANTKAYLAYEDALTAAVTADHEGGWLIKRQAVLEKSLADLRAAH